MSRKQSRMTILMSGIAYSTLATLASPAYAQDAATEADASNIEEVYVTARKKRELLVEVPMNIATVGSVEIAKRNLINKEDVFRTIAGAASPRGQLILRGLSGSNSSTPGTTSTFTDGVPYDFSNLYDVERVEVLRGPQGTLWGSNAIGGTVQVITTKPNLDEVEAKGSIQVSHERNRPGTGLRASAALNFPIIDGELAMRVTGSFGKENKKVLNTYTGNIGINEDHFIRAQLMWQPSSDTRLNLMYVNERDTDTGFVDVDVNSPTSHYEAILTPNEDATYGYDVAFEFPDCQGTTRTSCLGGVRTEGHDPLYTYYNLMDPFDYDYVDLFSVSFEKDDIFEGADLSYYGSHQRYKDFGQQAWWNRADANDMFRTWIIDKSKDRQWTHEIRLQSNDEDSPLQWTVGGYYDRFETLPADDIQWQYHASDDRSRAIAAYLWGDYWGYSVDPTVLGRELYGDGTKNYNITYNNYVAKELAFFGEVSYEADLGDAGTLEITGGIRYYDLKDDFDYDQSGIWVDSEGEISSTVTDDGENGTTKKVSVNYRPNNDIGIFAIYSEGYRRGGNNGPTAPEDCANDENIGSYVDRYSSDSIKNYEVGIKGTALDRRTQFSSAIYQIDWTDVQASVYMPSCGFSYVANAASARSRGVEFESSTQVMDGLALMLNASYTNSEMTSEVPALGAEDGDDMTAVPKYNFYVALDKEFELFNYDASARLEVNGYGSYKSHFNVRDEDISPAYEVVNLSGTLQLTDTSKLSIHVNNLLDDDIALYKRSRSRGDPSGNALWIEYARERNVVVRLDFEF